MFKNKMAMFFTLILLSFNISAAREEVKVDVQLSPAGSFEIKAELKGSLTKDAQGMYQAKKLTVKVKEFETGMDLRNKHTKEKLEFKKYPSITVSDIKAKGGKGIGVIKIMKKKKKIQFSYKEIAGGLLQATFPLSLKDFGISGINYMGVGVKDKVTVTANIKK